MSASELKREFSAFQKLMLHFLSVLLMSAYDCKEIACYNRLVRLLSDSKTLGTVLILLIRSNKGK